MSSLVALVTVIVYVVLVPLLVFFMVTTSFVRESQLSIRLPESSSDSESAPAAETLEITVTAGGDYLVNGRSLVDSRPATLQAAFRPNALQAASANFATQEVNPVEQVSLLREMYRQHTRPAPAPF